MDADREEDGLWRLAIMVDGSSDQLSFVEVRSKPMRLQAWFPPSPPPPRPGDGTALAVAKISLLDTFDNVHEYQTKKGVQLRAASSARRRYPHVTLASYRSMGDSEELVLMNLPDMERHTGLSRATSPAILVASSSFLASQGYCHLELVWVQVVRPLRLERVVLSGGAGGTTPLTPSLIGDAMQELSKLLEGETIVLRQGTTFSLPGRFSRSEAGEEERQHGEVELSVLETSPVMQGQLTRETEVVVVPQAEGDAPSLQSARSLHQPGGGASALEESGETRSLTSSNCSASDFRNEDEEEEDPTSDPSLELLTHPDLKLHRNHVLVPKQFAEQHELLQYQMVVLEPVGLPLSGGVADMVISTRAPGEEGGGSHAAILVWYNGQAELERYLSPPYPGYTYPEAVLRCSFAHPHLLYAIFHETLSPSRRFLITIKVSWKNISLLSQTVSLPCRLEKERKRVRISACSQLFRNYD